MRRKTSETYILAGLFCSMILSSCASQFRSLTVLSTPSGVDISVNEEYLGKTPVVAQIPDRDKDSKIYIKATKPGYEGDMKVMLTRNLPEKVFFSLEMSQSPVAREPNPGAGHASQQMMSGPTIVIPGGYSVNTSNPNGQENPKGVSNPSASQGQPIEQKSGVAPPTKTVP